MFDMVAGAGHVIPPYRRFRTAATSVAVHLILLLALIAVPLVVVETGQVPPPPAMMAFVAAAPSPPPPPPPPAPAVPRAAPRPRAIATAGQFAAPVEAAREIAPESGVQAGVVGGVVGGVEGGVEGGVVGGVLGGLPSELPPPPPPPAAPERPVPVRVGGSIQSPALIQRVEPEYPKVAMMARLEGVVIIEATVDTSGRVQSARILRSAGVLDGPALEAVRQWRYSPLSLNGRPTPFILTVTVAFMLERSSPLTD